MMSNEAAERLLDELKENPLPGARHAYTIVRLRLPQILAHERSAGAASLDVDWEQVGHDMHRHFWPGSVSEKHTDQGDCYKCRRMGEWLAARLTEETDR